MTSSLDETAVRHVAQLARLSITDEEVTRYAAQLSRVLDYFERLRELDTTGVEPTALPLPVSNVFREDVVRPSLDPERALDDAPDRQGAFFRVPRVLDQAGA